MFSYSFHYILENQTKPKKPPSYSYISSKAHTPHSQFWYPHPYSQTNWIYFWVNVKAYHIHLSIFVYTIYIEYVLKYSITLFGVALHILCWCWNFSYQITPLHLNTKAGYSLFYVSSNFCLYFVICKVELFFFWGIRCQNCCTVFFYHILNFRVNCGDTLFQAILFTT